jgi:hypothetical protein
VTGSDRLVVWLREAMDAAELAASRAAGLCGCHPSAPSWEFGDESTDGRILVVDEPHPGVKRKIGRRWNGSYEGMAMADHVVRHDPAAVLRRITADRALLDDLLDEKHYVLEDSWYRCSAANRAGDRNGNEKCDCGRDERVQRQVRLLAEGYGWTEETT